MTSGSLGKSSAKKPRSRAVTTICHPIESPPPPSPGNVIRIDFRVRYATVTVRCEDRRKIFNFTRRARGDIKIKRSTRFQFSVVY